MASLLDRAPADLAEPGPILHEVARADASEAEAPRSDFRKAESTHGHGWRPSGMQLILLLVLLPTLLAAAFEYLIVADQYESEAKFIVRAPQTMPSASSLGQMLGLPGSITPGDARSVTEYLRSHDAVDALGRGNLTAIFRRPEADPVTRLQDAAPKPETLLRYYRSMVRIDGGADNSIATLTVRTFRPADAQLLAAQLLRLGEQRVNSLNERMFNDGLAAASRQVREAEAEVEAAQVALTSFRLQHRDIDPERSGAAQIQATTELEQQVAAARGRFEAMAAKLSRSAPQYDAAARQVHALEAQLGAAQTKMAGSDRSLAASLGQYEELQTKQEFAAKRYQAAAESVQSAREQLLKQQLFIVPVVKPNLPGKALYPKRMTTVATVFFGLALAYAIGWLILAGVREHVA